MFARNNKIKLHRIGGETTTLGHQFWCRMDANVRRRLFGLLGENDGLQLALFGELLRSGPVLGAQGDGASEATGGAAGQEEADEEGDEGECTFYGQDERSEEGGEGEEEERELDVVIEKEMEEDEEREQSDDEMEIFAEEMVYEEDEEDDEGGAEVDEVESAEVDCTVQRKLVVHDRLLSLIEVRTVS